MYKKILRKCVIKKEHIFVREKDYFLIEVKVSINKPRLMLSLATTVGEKED